MSLRIARAEWLAAAAGPGQRGGMRAQKGPHGYEGAIGWIVVLAPVFYLAMYLPVASMAARHPWAVSYASRLYSPLPHSLHEKMHALWRSMDPEGQLIFSKSR